MPLPMTNIERHFQIQRLIRDIERAEDDVRAIQFALPTNRTGQDVFNRMEGVARALHAALEQIKAVPTLNDLETALSLSIEMVKEKRRCAEVAAETEKAHAANVSRFHKPSIKQNPQGE